MQRIVALFMLILLLSIIVPGQADVSVECAYGVVVPFEGWEGDPSPLYDGYCDHSGEPIPGYITNEFYWHGMVNHFITRAIWQDEGVIERTAALKGIDDIGSLGYLDGVAVPWCIPALDRVKVWLRPPGENWEGPFKALDCPKQEHQYHHIVHMNSGLELGYQTAQSWGLVAIDGTVLAWALDGVEVCIADTPSLCAGVPVDLYSWYLENVEFVEHRPVPRTNATIAE